MIGASNNENLKRNALETLITLTQALSQVKGTAEKATVILNQSVQSFVHTEALVGGVKEVVAR